MKGNLYNVKGSFQLKDLDIPNRQVAVYLAHFDNIDSDNDIIRKGAFAKSILERGPESTSNRKIQFLRHHDWEWQIGKFVELSEDNTGLYAVGQLGRSTQGEDALRDYEDGIIKEHSIGFQYISDKMRWINDINLESGGYYEINEVKLYEGSAVTFGSNSETYVVSVSKGEEKTSYIEKITKELDTCIKALANGKGTDERLHNLEMKVKYLNSQLISLVNVEPDPVHSIKSEPKIEIYDWNKVINSINF
ncbi:MAG: HK97 family phage prohead protease [Rhodobacteraceae bacterium]|nr:HK97 family phage prohead protease [Paracoccaceae bacterium]